MCDSFILITSNTKSFLLPLIEEFFVFGSVAIKLAAVNQVDDGYPENVNTQDPSGVSASTIAFLFLSSRGLHTRINLNHLPLTRRRASFSVQLPLLAQNIIVKLRLSPMTVAARMENCSGN
jgi:hypothetical protein